MRGAEPRVSRQSEILTSGRDDDELIRLPRERQRERREKGEREKREREREGGRERAIGHHGVYKYLDPRTPSDEKKEYLTKFSRFRIFFSTSY